MFYSIASIIPVARQLAAAGKHIVLATGFFDLLHSEHIAFLQKAKSSGDVLIVAVESDVRARQIKGEGRPIEPQSLRCQKVSKYADYVVALDDNFNNLTAYESLIAATRPTIYAVSSHTSHQDIKQKLTEKYGGKLLVVHEFNPNISTSKIISTQNKL